MAALVRHRARQKRQEVVLMVESPQTVSLGAHPQVVFFEYSRSAFQAIQDMVLDSCRKFPKGGDEAAGVLYGTREGNIVRVQAARRIACEHARGRALLLSTNDKVALREQLTREATKPALQGLAVMGWFLSHTAPIRAAITASGRTVLSLTDLQTFDEYFQTPGQVTLVLRSNASATIQASVFVRRADGSVNTENSDLDFPFAERWAFPDRPEGVESKRADPSAPTVRETAPPAALATAAGANAATISVPTGGQTVPTTVPVASPSLETVSVVTAALPISTEPVLAPAAAALSPADSVAPARENTSNAVSPSQRESSRAKSAKRRYLLSAGIVGLTLVATAIMPRLASYRAAPVPSIVQSAVLQPEPVTKPPASEDGRPKTAVREPPGKAVRQDIIKQVLPVVPVKARNTIRGTVTISIRVDVDATGSVVDVKNESPASSRFFGDLALQAARQWKFAPVDPRRSTLTHDWTLHFQFVGDPERPVSVQVVPSLSDGTVQAR